MTQEVRDRHAERLDLTPSPRLLAVLGEIPYQPWQCLAELIDNAFDDFITDTDRDASDTPMVRVTLPKGTTAEGDEIVCVADNGRGMSRDALERALSAGYSSQFRHGSLGLFGVGFNIATARLGSVTEVRTTRAGDPEWLVAEIDFHRMEQERTFSVPLRREPKDDPAMHGTEVVVRRLKPELRDRLRRPATASQIRERLGNVYSYMLRSADAMPELPGPMFAGRGFALSVNQTRVRPRLPCVWSASRSVDYRGREIPAVIDVSRDLRAAWACMDCGHWHHSSVEGCVECQGENLSLRERRIVGWVGVQRYNDPNDFGIDLLRNGRKILLSDKSLFDWENPDTGEVWTEYPIEFGSTTGGRLVGEIHLDHVEVTYQKNDFVRGSTDWATAVATIRGEGPLQPRKAGSLGYEENASPIGLLFNGYRRNDAGLKCLVPGNGAKATHERAREWAANFRKGQAEYLSDERWYEAATAHDRGKAGQGEPPPAAPVDPQGGVPTDGGDDDLLIRTGLGAPGPASGPPSPGRPDPVPETEAERFARYQANARPMLDLCGNVSLPHLGRRAVMVYETQERLVDSSGRNTPSASRTVRGSKIEVYVNGTHDVFRGCGRDVRDYAIVELAEGMRTLARADDGIARVAADITLGFPDQRFTDAAMRERAASVLGRIREALESVAAKHSAALWTCLPITEKEIAARNATVSDPRLVWTEATVDGRFAAHVGPGAVAAIVRGRPDLVLDGAVFITTWASWPNADAKNRKVEHLARMLDWVAEFAASTEAKTSLTLAMTRLTLDALDQEVVQEAGGA
jgi:hypothetical protein